jgi:hypothetical protein
MQDGDHLPEVAGRLLGAEGESLIRAANPWLSERAAPPPGTHLIIPPPQWRIHLVSDGETLAVITGRYADGMLSAADLLAANPWIGAGKEPAPGCRLLIPLARPLPLVK